MGREHTLDKIQRVFFEGAEESILTPVQQQQIKRYRAAFSVWLDKPILSDTQVVKFLQAEHDVSKQQAYTDIRYIKVLLGNVKNAGKEWQRYKADQLVSDAVALLEPREVEKEVEKPKKKGKVVGFTAIDPDEEEDITEKKTFTINPSKTDVLIAEAKIKAAKALVAIHKLDKDEGEPMPWEDIVPHDWEATSDPSVIGLKPIANIEEKIKKLKKKYSQDIEIVDTNYEDITTEGQETDLLQ